MKARHLAALGLFAIVWAAVSAMVISNNILRVDRELVIRLVIDLEPLRKK